MALSEFWVREAIEFVRKLRDQCERCDDCGALACGKKHANWHAAVTQKLDDARTEIISLRQRATALENRMTAAENEITSLKTRVTALGG